MYIIIHATTTTTTTTPFAATTHGVSCPVVIECHVDMHHTVRSKEHTGVFFHLDPSSVLLRLEHTGGGCEPFRPSSC
jgi:hypothetical protein